MREHSCGAVTSYPHQVFLGEPRRAVSPVRNRRFNRIATSSPRSMGSRQQLAESSTLKVTYPKHRRCDAVTMRQGAAGRLLARGAALLALSILIATSVLALRPKKLPDEVVSWFIQLSDLHMCEVWHCMHISFPRIRLYRPRLFYDSIANFFSIRLKILAVTLSWRRKALGRPTCSR